MMPLRPYLYKRVAIIGVGLMGGSLGLAIKKHKLAREVIGHSQKSTTLEAALKIQAIDHAHNDIKSAVSNADLVVLATPVSIITSMLSVIGPNLKRGCTVTDVGSSKASIVKAAGQYLPNQVSFIGSHPLAGSEKKGVEHAHVDLFNNAQCIMTPTDKTNRMALSRLKHFWTKLGCQVKILSADEHDKIMGYTSHLPHIVAYALMQVIPVEYLGFGAQGLKDTTRIAASSPQMWNDICLGNPNNIVQGLDALVKDLSFIRKAIISSDAKGLTEYLQKAKEKRDKLV